MQEFLRLYIGILRVSMVGICPESRGLLLAERGSTISKLDVAEKRSSTAGFRSSAQQILTLTLQGFQTFSHKHIGLRRCDALVVEVAFQLLTDLA